MRKGFRTISVLLLTAMLVMVMAACSSSNNGNGNSNGENVGNNTNTSSNDSNDSNDSNASKPELRRLSIWQNEDYNTYPVAKLLEEKTGYKVKYDMLPQDKASDKLNLLMGSGENYDVVTYGADMALFSDYAQKGALVDLQPLIDKYGPNIKEAVSQESMDALKVDGKLYALPVKVNYKVGTSILIRTDWLEKVGMQMPTTTDELVAVLKAFKEKDPGGNGKQNVPLTIKGDQAMLENITGAFGMPNSWNDVDGKLVPRVLDPAYPDYVNYVSGLYKDGLIDHEFVANKDATAKEKFSSGKAGAIIVHWADVPSLSDALKKNVPDATFAYVSALKGPNGEAGFSANIGFDRISFIPKASDHPEDAIKWFNATLEPDTFKEMAIGQEGVHYTVEADGGYMPILPIFSDERNLANNFLLAGDERVYPDYWQARVRKSPVMFEVFKTLNNDLPDEYKIDNVLSMAPFLPQYAKNNQQLEQMVGDYTVKLIAGADTLDGLADFQAKYKAAGEEASEKEINEWYTNR